jgi:hypothetical protein
MHSLPHCQTITKDPLISLSEPKTKSKLVVSNPTRGKVIVIKVDGCVISDNVTLRCDYALDPQTGIEIYIELKGSNINHAIEQLESTIKRLSLNPQKGPKLCIVVSTRVPRQGTNIQSLQLRFKCRYNARLRIKNGQDRLDLETLN